MDKAKVLDFWFDELSAEDWYKKNLDLDIKIKDRFLDTYKQAIRGELFSWRKTVEGRLAEILVLDQFSRNIFRNKAQAFQYDDLALVLSQEASVLDEAQSLPIVQRAFLYMPYMHSESLLIHGEAVRLFSQPGLENNLKFELAHKKIIFNNQQYF